MKEYLLLEARGIQGLEDQINSKVAEGWSPNGNLSVQEVLGHARYTQVMVRDKRDINESPDNGKQLLHG